MAGAILSNRFTLGREIGRGAFGVVYEAYDAARSAPIALKVLEHVTPGAIFRFKREFRALAELRHPNLVRLHELFADGDEWFFTMDLVRGRSFLEHVRPSAPRDGRAAPSHSIVQLAATVQSDHDASSLGVAATMRSDDPATGLNGDAGTVGAAVYLSIAPPPTELEIGRLRAAAAGLVEGVAALHRAGKLHRDLKPSNVLVDEEGAVRILDFGMVAELCGPRAEESGTRAIIGTPGYMAPEQAAGAKVASSADLYAIGVMLFEALTGTLPFMGSVADVMFQKLTQVAKDPRELVADVPDDLAELARDLLAREPSARPSANEVLRRLRRATSVPPPSMAGRAGLVGPDAELVGRERTLAHLDETWARVRGGESATVLVHGMSGMGKSALVRRFVETVRAQGDALVLEGRSFEQESVPFKALDALMDALTEVWVALPPEAAAQIAPDDAQALARLFPVLRRVDVVASQLAPPETPDLQELRRRACAAFRALFHRLASTRPLLVVLDDLQWGDIDSADLIVAALEEPDAPPMLLLASYRTEDAAESELLVRLRDALDGRERVHEIDVGPLAPDDATRLVESLLAHAHAPAGPHGRAAGDAVAIARESGGSPYFAGELVRYVNEGHALGAARASLESVLLARLARLSPVARRLLEIVSVAGRPLPYDVAQRACGDAGASDGVYDGVEALRAARLLRTRAKRAQDELECYHDRVRETVVAALEPAAAAAVHGTIARALEATQSAEHDADPEMLALHFARAGQPRKASEYARRAGDRAAQALAFDRAASFYQAALEAGESAELRTKLAGALANAGRGREAAAAYLEAARVAGAPADIDLRRRAAEQLLLTGHMDEGVAVMREVLAAVDLAYPATPLRALLLVVWHMLVLRVRGLAFRTRTAAEVAPATLTRLDACWSIAHGLGLTDNVRGAHFQTLNLRMALAVGERSRVVRAIAMHAAHVSSGGEPSRARTDALLARARDEGRRTGEPYGEALVTLVESIAECLRGGWRRSVACADEAGAVLRDRCTGVSWEVSTAHTFALFSMFPLGRLGELARRVPALLREAASRGDLYSAAQLNAVPGAIALLMQGRPDEARARVADAMSHWSPASFHLQHARELLAVGRIDLYAGDGLASWRRLEARWRPMKRALILRIELQRITMGYLRAQSALLAAEQRARAGAPSEAAPLLRAAARDARLLLAERAGWSQPMGTMVLAALAGVRGDDEGASSLAARAEEGYRLADMAIYAAAARMRRGELVGGDEGRALVADARETFAREGVSNPDRMVNVFAPRCGRLRA